MEYMSLLGKKSYQTNLEPQWLGNHSLASQNSLIPQEVSESKLLLAKWMNKVFLTKDTQYVRKQVLTESKERRRS